MAPIVPPSQSMVLGLSARLTRFLQRKRRKISAGPCRPASNRAAKRRQPERSVRQADPPRDRRCCMLLDDSCSGHGDDRDKSGNVALFPWHNHPRRRDSIPESGETIQTKPAEASPVRSRRRGREPDGWEPADGQGAPHNERERGHARAAPTGTDKLPRPAPWSRKRCRFRPPSLVPGGRGWATRPPRRLARRRPRSSRRSLPPRAPTGGPSFPISSRQTHRECGAAGRDCGMSRPPRMQAQPADVPQVRPGSTGVDRAIRASLPDRASIPRSPAWRRPGRRADEGSPPPTGVAVGRPAWRWPSPGRQ